MPDIALLYDDDAYLEPVPGKPRAPGASAGLMGRQVAGRSFLDAYLTHGRWDALAAVAPSAGASGNLLEICREHPSSRGKARRLRVVERSRFLEGFFPDPPARVFHHPAPPEEGFAWARQHAGPGAFALCGVTHTLASAAAVAALRAMVVAPFESYDALICTSRSVERMVRAVTDRFADDLRERHGGTPRLRPRLEVIPLGVDPDRFRPATPEQRAAARTALGIAEDEAAVLFVGRLSHHAKAHPFPLYHGAAEAASLTGRRVHLILAGWFANEAVGRAFASGANEFANGLRVSFIDGTEPSRRAAVWHAADVFASLSDNIQETFGLAVIEAMSSGLPVVASDWDGYRDLVEHGRTGWLVPTYAVAGATRDATARLLVGETSYDHFLAECNQATAVDPAATAAAFARVIADPALGREFGQAGRRRVLERFAWSRVIAAYEALWESQAASLPRKPQPAPAPSPATPAAYPSPEVSFAGYPTLTLGPDTILVAAPDAPERLDALREHPLTHYAARHRVTDPKLLRDALDAASRPAPLAAIDRVFSGGSIPPTQARATIAWMLKYGLLRRDGASS